jgi:hypothetical protein
MRERIFVTQRKIEQTIYNVEVSVAYNFQTGNNKIKLLTEYKIVTQKVCLITLYSPHCYLGEKYDVIPQNGDSSRESNPLWFFKTKSVIKKQRRYRTQYGKDPPSDNVDRRSLKQFKETDTSLHLTEAQNCCCDRNSYTANAWTSYVP